MDEAKKIKLKNRMKVIGALLLLICLLGGSMLASFKIKEATYTGRPVFLAMEQGNRENIEKVFDDLKAGKDSPGQFTDWSSCDFQNARSMGGVLVGDSEKKYRFKDKLFYGDLWVVEDKDSDDAYVIYMECAYTKWGRRNEGVSGVAVTTWDYYYNRDEIWDYIKDENTGRAGSFCKN